MAQHAKKYSISRVEYDAGTILDLKMYWYVRTVLEYCTQYSYCVRVQDLVEYCTTVLVLLSNMSSEQGANRAKARPTGNTKKCSREQATFPHDAGTLNRPADHDHHTMSYLHAT
jgi:hypothetical protein